MVIWLIYSCLNTQAKVFQEQQQNKFLYNQQSLIIEGLKFF